MMQDTTKVDSMIPVRMILTISQGNRVMKKLDFFQSFCCSAAERIPLICDGWLYVADD